MRRLPIVTVLLLALGLIAAPLVSAAPPAPASCPSVVNNMLVTASITFCRTSYTVADSDNNGVIIIRPASDGVVVDGNGMTLKGKGGKGYGIWVDNTNNTKGYSVTIKNFNISSFYYGVRVEGSGVRVAGSSGVTIDLNNISNNFANKGRFLNINVGPNAGYGGGIMLNKQHDSRVTNNILRNQSTGVDSYNSSYNLIERNNAANNTAWGIRLYQSSNNQINYNTVNNVDRTGDRGFDSAAVLLVEGSNFNQIGFNDLRYSGDGFFIGNQNSTSTSNNNHVEANDGSFSPHNCFEATFGSGNTFVNNIARSCAYGFWLGYARQVKVYNNIVENNSYDGLNIEHGCQGTFAGNALRNNGRYGLATNGTPSQDARWRCEDPENANRHEIGITGAGNTITGNGSAGVFLPDTSATSVSANLITANRYGISLSGSALSAGAAHGNDLTCIAPCTYAIYSLIQYNAQYNWWDSTSPLVFGPVDTTQPLKEKAPTPPPPTEPLPCSTTKLTGCIAYTNPNAGPQL